MAVNRQTKKIQNKYSLPIDFPSGICYSTREVKQSRQESEVSKVFTENIINWLLEMDFIAEEDIDAVASDLQKIREVAPRFFMMLALEADR